MGFFRVLGRVLQGKPGFTVEGAPDDDAPVVKSDAHPVTDKLPRYDEDGNKLAPQIDIEHETHRRGDEYLELWAFIHNKSEASIEIDKIYIFGTKLELDRVLKPQGSYQMRLYRGPALSTDNYHYADLQYKRIDTGDYFAARFEIEYDLVGEGKYVPEDLKPIRPIKSL